MLKDSKIKIQCTYLYKWFCLLLFLGGGSVGNKTQACTGTGNRCEGDHRTEYGRKMFGWFYKLAPQHMKTSLFDRTTSLGTNEITTVAPEKPHKKKQRFDKGASKLSKKWSTKKKKRIQYKFGIWIGIPLSNNPFHRHLTNQNTGPQTISLNIIAPKTADPAFSRHSLFQLPWEYSKRNSPPLAVAISFW